MSRFSAERRPALLLIAVLLLGGGLVLDTSHMLGNALLKHQQQDPEVSLRPAAAALVRSSAQGGPEHALAARHLAEAMEALAEASATLPALTGTLRARRALQQGADAVQCLLRYPAPAPEGDLITALNRATFDTPARRSAFDRAQGLTRKLTFRAPPDLDCRT